MMVSECQQEFQAWTVSLRDRICQSLENIEQEYLHPHLLPGTFQQKTWNRPDPSQPSGEGGGGTMAILHGRVFEKAGVNISTVFGQFSPQFSQDIPGAAEDPRFWACGISLVIHPMNPHVPTIHMNTRMIVTTKVWFGGGMDLTPTIIYPEDNQEFHQQLRRVCDQYHDSYYPKFKLWCDDYFYLPHRQEARGIGGIFFDNLDSGDRNQDYQFTQAVGQSFLDIYPSLVRKRLNQSWTVEDKHAQLVKRGRYVEFNLLYDRGTQFGLKTQGNVEAILMSLPPVASW
jgi:coproporphyrinogen III oxidase